MASHPYKRSREDLLAWSRAFVHGAHERRVWHSRTLRSTQERWARRVLVFDTVREILNLTLRAAFTVYLIKLMIDGTAVTALLTAVARALH